MKQLHSLYGATGGNPKKFRQGVEAYASPNRRYNDCKTLRRSASVLLPHCIFP